MALLSTLDLLRPLVSTKSWDYCIVWKFTNDPLMCLEWVGCCCSGSQGVCGNVKYENEAYLCKDSSVKHLLQTDACVKLAMVPSSLPLYPGIHGEVAASKQPFWQSNDLSGSQLVVPVDGGLIELYRSKHVPTDERTIEALIARLSNIVDPKLDEGDSKTRLNSYIFDHIGPNLQLFIPLPELTSHPNTPGLTSGNNNEVMVAKQMKVKKQCRSKNLEAERNRRKRMKDNLLILRSLVPKISKMDTLSIVGDAIKYIQELQENAKELEDELKALEEHDCMVDGHEVEDVDVEVEVHKTGARKYLLKVFCSHKLDGFSRLIEAVQSLGLQVINVSMTSCFGLVLNTLTVEAKEEVNAKSLKDSLLSSWTSSELDQKL